MSALARATLSALALAIAPWTIHAQSPAPSDALRREDFARARACITQASNLSGHDRAEQMADCTTALAPSLASQRASFAALTAAAYRDDRAAAASVRWAMRCHRDAALAPSLDRASALRRECAAIIREQFHRVAWIKNTDELCQWTAREDRFGVGESSHDVPLERDGAWVAVQPGRTRLSAICDRAPMPSDGPPPQTTLTVALREAIRYRITRTTVLLAQ